MKYCLKCGEEVEKDDNFCPRCGHWTSKGYSFLKNKDNKEIINGKIVKQYNKITNLFILLFFSVFLAVGMTIYRGQNILKPFIYIKRMIMSYEYGYNTTILKTNNQYFNLKVDDIKIARKKISEDFSTQQWQCKNNFEIGKIEDNLEQKYNIASVNFCDISLDEAKKISEVITKVYSLFPGIDGYLTNIAVTNDINKTKYVAYFQPVYQFVNSTNKIEEYNRVNKTQILLNSYYFVNDDNLSKKVIDNWYVSDATWNSLIAHEFGHYILFVSLLKSEGVNGITLVTKNNENQVNKVIEMVNNQTYSKKIIDGAIKNYNDSYNSNITVEEFAELISNYASSKNARGNLVYDEIIAEAVHDYYLHGSNANGASLKIIELLNLNIK